MLLFLMGIDFLSLAILFIILIIFGILIFSILRRVFRKVLKETSEYRINWLARICAFILSPLIVFSALALFIYFSMD